MTTRSMSMLTNQRHTGAWEVTALLRRGALAACILLVVTVVGLGLLNGGGESTEGTLL